MSLLAPACKASHLPNPLLISIFQQYPLPPKPTFSKTILSHHATTHFQPFHYVIEYKSIATVWTALQQCSSLSKSIFYQTLPSCHTTTHCQPLCHAIDYESVTTILAVIPTATQAHGPPSPKSLYSAYDCPQHVTDIPSIISGTTYPTQYHRLHCQACPGFVITRSHQCSQPSSAIHSSCIVF